MKKNAINKQYISSVENLPYYLDLNMVSGLTGLSYETVKKYCQKGIIKACKIGREWRVSQVDFLRIGNADN
ncbi:MAG: helix-turn-helix domain-containing protein [Oscillospiraceae bacterium]|nr:helix-turn-helix domain-containing protein [Oscillospiraceae bacterium]